MSQLDKKLSNIRLLEKGFNSEKYEANMKIFIKKIKINSEDDAFFYKNILSSNNQIYNTLYKGNCLYIYYDINLNIDDLLSLKDKKEGNIKGHCEPISKTEIDELFSKEGSMCKIRFKRINDNNRLENCIGTGFFLKFNYKNIPFNKCLVTNCHVLDEENTQPDREIRIEYKNKKKVIEITKEGKLRKVFNDKNLDYTIIELFDDDDIKDFFRVDSDLIRNDPKVFIDNDIFTLQFPKGNDLSFSGGKILSIENDKLLHNCSTNFGSSGSPILSRYSNCSVIGLHYGGEKGNSFNLSTPISAILENINNNFIKKKEKNEGKNEQNEQNEKIKEEIVVDKSHKNYIVATFEITEENVNKDIRIICTFEDIRREGKTFVYAIDHPKYENLKEIKGNCDIFINNKLIPFTYYHKFNKKGKYQILYSFRKPITKTNHFFSQCYNLTYVNLYNFNNEYVTNMESMFWGCESLKDVNISGLVTKNALNISYMFFRCESLTNLDLSSFDTSNVVDMRNMFSSCKSLKRLNLANFSSQNAKYLDSMFSDCNELKKNNVICKDKKILGLLN